MRTIKKTIKTTVVNVFAFDMGTFNPATGTVQLKRVGGFEVVGGLGKRLCESRARRMYGAEYGSNLQINVANIEHTYKIDKDVFIKYATICDGEADDDDTDDDTDDETDE